MVKCIAILSPLHSVIFESHRIRVILYIAMHCRSVAFRSTVEKGGETTEWMQGDKIGREGIFGAKIGRRGGNISSLLSSHQLPNSSALLTDGILEKPENNGNSQGRHFPPLLMLLLDH